MRGEGAVRPAEPFGIPRWAEEAEGQEAIRTLAAEYFTLMGTILAAPEASHESVCCSEEVLQELTLYGWMASTNLYPRISIQVTLSRPETYPDGTVRVTAGLKTALKSCRDISRTSFTSDANLESIDFSEEHRLTLSGAGENWTVAWDAFSSDFGRMESGYATNHRDDAFCAEHIRSYFSLRANALDGGYVAGNPEFCIGALRSDAFDFAQALLKDRPIDGDAATQVPVDECIRVEYLSENWMVECSIFVLPHTITTFPQADSDQDLVVGDLYKQFGHACSIVEYPEPLWSD